MQFYQMEDVILHFFFNQNAFANYEKFWLMKTEYRMCFKMKMQTKIKRKLNNRSNF